MKDKHRQIARVQTTEVLASVGALEPSGRQMPYDSDPRKPYQVDAPPMAPAAEDDIAPPPVQIEPEPEPLPAPSDGGEGGAGGSALAVEALRQSVDEGRAEGTDSAREILRRGAELYRAAASAASEGDRPARDDLMSRRTSLLR